MTPASFKHIAHIRKSEIRQVGLWPKSETVTTTEKIRQKVEGRSITMEQVRRVIEGWEYQRRSPLDKDERSLERYAHLEGMWHIAVVYVPGADQDQEHNALATSHIVRQKTMDDLFEAGVLQKRDVSKTHR